MSAIPPPQPADLPPWEAIPTRAEPFEDLGIRAQRDELLSAVGLLIEWIIGPGQHITLKPYPLMTESVNEMGHRYGPWAR